MFVNGRIISVNVSCVRNGFGIMNVSCPKNLKTIESVRILSVFDSYSRKHSKVFPKRNEFYRIQKDYLRLIYKCFRPLFEYLRLFFECMCPRKHSFTLANFLNISKISETFVIASELFRID